MFCIGTPFSASSRKIMLLGAGELGKEVAIEAQRLGIEVVAVDRYANAPAMQIAQHQVVIDMLDVQQLKKTIYHYKPAYIIPEVEAIATQALLELEHEGFNVIPTARATQLTMDREGIRRLASEELGIKTSTYVFADTQQQFQQAIVKLGLPIVVKPIMSSSGKGQSIIYKEEEILPAWDHAQQQGRAGAGCVIVESFIRFDYEITLLTIRHKAGTDFCAPIGHRQEAGDYRESWQPQAMSPIALQKAKDIARKITDNLGGWGLFGVEFFIRGEDVYFSEVSPRPHDTGMVTMISQNFSEFALHLRAILGLPIPEIVQYAPAASHALVVAANSVNIEFCNVDKVLQQVGTELRLFGKPNVNGERRMGVALALGESVIEAREKAAKMIQSLTVIVH